MAVLTPAVQSPAFAPETVTPIKMSEAIRIGSMLTEQTYYCQFKRDSETNKEYTCALGAALVGVYGDSARHHLLSKTFPRKIWESPGKKCPVATCSNGVLSIANTIAHLNDRHVWKREKIADWLEGIGL